MGEENFVFLYSDMFQIKSDLGFWDFGELLFGGLPFTVFNIIIPNMHVN
jgi:hypothetical protein